MKKKLSEMTDEELAKESISSIIERLDKWFDSVDARIKALEDIERERVVQRREPYIN